MTIQEQQISIDQLRAQAIRILDQIAVGAAQREGERQLPFDEIALLASERLLTWRVPTRWSGPGASVRDVIGFVIDVAAVDANIAQAIRPALGFVEGLFTASPEHQERWYPAVLRGDVFGLAHGEVGAPNGVLRTTIKRDGDGWRINGRKFYSTGTLFADWVSISGVDEEGNQQSFVIPTDREGVERIDDWDGIGQRLTASGSTVLDNVRLDEDDVSGRLVPEGGRSLVTPFQQLVLAAVEAGIAENSLKDAVSYAQEKSRPIKHSSASRSVDDPYIQHAVGDISARAYVARAAVLRAADAIDRAHLPSSGHQEAVDAAVEVAQAQYIAVESALKAAELIFDVGGGSTALRKYNLDRHWRNARTVANHNPRYYKAGVVGAYRLTGAEPPTTGLF